MKQTTRPSIGAGDCTDPVWCVLNTSNDQIEMMLEALLQALEDKVSSKIQTHLNRKDADLFSDWEREFVRSVNAAYEERTLRGFNDQPLSGKQLVYLWSYYNRLAKELAEALALEGDL